MAAVLHGLRTAADQIPIPLPYPENLPFGCLIERILTYSRLRRLWLNCVDSFLYSSYLRSSTIECNAMNIITFFIKYLKIITGTKIDTE